MNDLNMSCRQASLPISKKAQPGILGKLKSIGQRLVGAQQKLQDLEVGHKNLANNMSTLTSKVHPTLGQQPSKADAHNTMEVGKSGRPR